MAINRGILGLRKAVKFLKTTVFSGLLVALLAQNATADCLPAIVCADDLSALLTAEKNAKEAEVKLLQHRINRLTQ